MADVQIKAVITAKDEASKVLNDFGKGVGTVAKDAAIAVGVAGAAMVAFGVLSVKAFTESQDAIAQTNAVLASTKGVAGVTADSVDKLSKSLQKITKYSDEDVRSVENLLLTFTAIGKDIFPQATTVVLDMATALGEDTKSASIQLGKALQDPVLGITALRRVGVNFSDAQKEVIKKLVETGQKAKAQQLILAELKTEFGGSAEAAGKTFAGSLAKLKNSLNDIEESLGSAIVRGLTPFAQKAAELMASVDWEKVINNTTRVVKNLAETLNTIWQTYLVPIIRTLKEFASQVGEYLSPKLTALKNTIMQDLAPAMQRFWDNQLKPLIETLGPLAGKGLVWVIGLVIDAANLLEKGVAELYNFFDTHRLVLELLAGAFIAVKASMFFGTAIDAITVGFATMRLITIPSLITSLGALSAAFVAAMPYAAIGAFVVWFASKMKEISGYFNEINGYKTSLSDDAHRIQAQAKADYAAGKLTKAQYIKINEIASAEADSAGKRATGGPVTGGVPYMVGEKGPEMIVPSQSGTVIPNNKLGGSTVNVSFSGIFTGSEMEFRKLAVKVFQAGADAASMQNMDVSSMSNQQWSRI